MSWPFGSKRWIRSAAPASWQASASQRAPRTVLARRRVTRRPASDREILSLGEPVVDHAEAELHFAGQQLELGEVGRVGLEPAVLDELAVALDGEGEQARLSEELLDILGQDGIVARHVRPPFPVGGRSEHGTCHRDRGPSLWNFSADQICVGLDVIAGTGLSLARQAGS